MKFEYWVLGKTKESHFIATEQVFLKRIKRYTKLNYKTFPDVKGAGNDKNVLKFKEGEMIMNQIEGSDYLILLDENGRQYTSVEFAEKINIYQISSHKRVIFLTGGAFGFDDLIYKRANELLSLSKMTFSHQMIRSFFLEQIYRGFSILNGEKYHNE